MDLDTALIFPFLIQQYTHEYDEDGEIISSTPIPKKVRNFPKYQGLSKWVG